MRIGISQASAAARLFFYTSNAIRMTIDPSGRVGIGDTTPSYPLDVVGDINFTGSLLSNGA